MMTINDEAAAMSAVVVTADSDVGMLLALRRAENTSVIDLRHVAETGGRPREAGLAA